MNKHEESCVDAKYFDSEDKKTLARKKDTERKRLSRLLRPPKKRSEMTNEELIRVRESDKVRKQNERMNQTSQEKENNKEKDRKRKARGSQDSNRKAKQKQRKTLTLDEKERKNLETLIHMRKRRLLQTEEMKSLARYKAKVGMRTCRKDGPMRDYLERNKRHVWAVKWRKFLSKNPILRDLEEKKKKKKKK